MVMKYAIQIDHRPVTLPRGEWTQRRGRYLEQFPEMFTPAQALEAVATEIGVTTADPSVRDEDVRIMVFRRFAGQTPDYERIFTGYRPAAGTPGTRTGVPGGCPILTPARYVDAVPGVGVPVIEAKDVPPPTPGDGVPGTGATPPPGFVVPGRGANEPGTGGAGTGTAVPADPSGIDRPRVWLRTSAPPPADVRAVLDGITTYHRTAVDRWVPAGQTGPGFAWHEIPAAVRIDATRPVAPTADGHLATDPTTEPTGGQP